MLCVLTVILCIALNAWRGFWSVAILDSKEKRGSREGGMGGGMGGGRGGGRGGREDGGRECAIQAGF